MKYAGVIFIANNINNVCERTVGYVFIYRMATQRSCRKQIDMKTSLTVLNLNFD